MVAAGASQFTALLWFQGELYRQLTERSASIAVGRMLGDTWLVRASLARVLSGGIHGGADDPDAPLASIQGGWMAGVQLSRRFVVEGWPRLYIGGSAALAVQQSTAAYEGKAATVSLRAADLRLGATAGWVLWKRVVPYAALRVFGGPVSWPADPDSSAPIGGTDRRHFQLGGGVSAIVTSALYLTAEWTPLGERAMSAEIGARF